MKLDVKALGLSLGIFWGISILLITYWFLIMGMPGNTLVKIRNIYLGYSVSWIGGLIGFVWGFVDGFICGSIIAWIYNKFSCKSSGTIEAV